MSVYSDIDIKKNLGKHIAIFPLKEENIKGASYNLSISKYAWSNGKQLVAVDASNSGGLVLKLPASSTTLIMTEECVYVDNTLCGTYHSKVTLVSKGLGHIGTTLDPQWVGPSLVAVHNHNSCEVELLIGSTFVSLIFYKLRSKSVRKNQNSPGRIRFIEETTFEFDQWIDESWRKDSDSLIEKMKNSPEFKQIIKNLSIVEKIRASGLGMTFIALISLALIILIGVGVDTIFPKSSTYTAGVIGSLMTIDIMILWNLYSKQ